MSAKLTPGPVGETLVFDRRVLLLVEGPDDQAFAAKQISLGTDADDWHVHFMVGKYTDWTNLIEIALDGRWFAENGSAVGLIMDADTDASGSGEKARSVLRRAGMPVPSRHGEVLSDGRWKAGYFIAPDGAAVGALEELLIRVIDPARRTAAEDYIAHVTTTFGAPLHPQKAVLQAYFSGQRKLIKSIPVAVQIADVIPPEASEFDEFRHFLSDLSGL